MVKINCKVKAKYNYKRIQELQKKLPQTIKESVEDIIKNIQGCAIKLLGTDNNGIVCELVKTETKEVIGRVYTDQSKMPWSWFREFGTRNLCSATTHRNY